MTIHRFDREFPFELTVCRWAESGWPPERSLPEDRTVVVARQLGTKRRRWDTVLVECDREALRRRGRFGERELDSDLLHVVRNAPAEWAWYRDALPDPGYPWRYVRAAVHRAADRDLVETRRSGNRIELRRRWRYPEWVDRIIAVENKPDLDASAASDLGPQLERDVAMGLADEVWVATQTTGATVEPAMLEGLPVEAGILTVDPRGMDVSVAWLPRSLAVDEPGTRILERPDGDGASAARFEYAGPGYKRDKRLEIAERAYGRGWRSYVDAMRPDCRHFRLQGVERALVPACDAKACHQTPGECAGNCPDFEPEPPTWRTRGWPLEGGPGKTLQRLLEERRRRHRPAPEPE